MAFVIRDEDRAENNKQHLNLSGFAYEVVQNDMFAFDEEKLSGFINRVFEYYYPIAESSISRTISSMRGELTKVLSGISGDEKTKRRIIEKLIMQKKDSLIKKAESYDKGKSFKFWLNNKNLEYLTEDNSEFSEDEFYSRRGKYIKCVIEEYARLPYVERELIYFSPFVDAVKDAVRDEKQIRVVTGTDKIYSVYPYRILRDPLSVTNYLVGYCKRYDFPASEEQPCSFKISALKSVKVEKSKSAFIKESERKQLIREIAKRGVQFMVDNETEIHVKLTEAGVYKYRRHTHLRPALAERRDNNVFVFNCTPAQAEFYFFKFGKDAEVLVPVFLRDKFKSMYKAATDAYIHQSINNNRV